MKENFIRLKIGHILFGCLVTGPLLAEPITPAPGTALRADLLDAIRIPVANDLGAPIEFVVGEMLVDGDRAFLTLAAQRPGGGAIDLASAPMVVRGDVVIDFVDGPNIVGYLFAQNGNWYIKDYSVGATDLWWVGGPYCQNYASLLPPNVCK